MCPRDRRTVAAILAAAGLAALLRLPFVGTGLGMDEGGYGPARSFQTRNNGKQLI